VVIQTLSYLPQSSKLLTLMILPEISGTALLDSD
jgi:hypothetical protein